MSVLAAAPRSLPTYSSRASPPRPYLSRLKTKFFNARTKLDPADSARIPKTWEVLLSPANFFLSDQRCKLAERGPFDPTQRAIHQHRVKRSQRWGKSTNQVGQFNQSRPIVRIGAPRIYHD
jgi:hypothetical protein